MADITQVEKQKQNNKTDQAAKASKRLPYIALRDMVFYPTGVVSVEVGRGDSLQALRASMDSSENEILLVAQKDSLVEIPLADDLYRVGTVAALRQVAETSGGSFKMLCEGLQRVRVRRFGSRGGVNTATVEPYPLDGLSEEDNIQAEALRRQILKHFEDYTSKSGIVSPATATAVLKSTDSQRMADLVCMNLNLSLEEQQSQLEAQNLLERLETLLDLLVRESEIMGITQEINQKVQARLDQNQKEYVLREQIRSIQEELGDADETSEIFELEEKLESSGVPDEYKEKLRKEIRRLSRMPDNYPDTAVQKNWLDLVINLPFGKVDKENLDLKHARKVLERDHYGLEKVKDRILEYVAVRSLQTKSGDLRVKGPILCLVGPPGVGKTSIAKSIASALGRKYVRMSLGGIHDEAEIRGHRRTYVGAMPGRIIQGIRQAEIDNPLFLLDEIDKLGADFRGDPSSALLEVLDPEQNNNFRDHYIEIPYDLSQVLFITTANSAWDIPEPLLDRMELIEISGYTEEDKVQIASRHLLPKQKEANAIPSKQLSVSRLALARLISWYTSEAGVRQLDRELAKLCRKVAVQIAEEGEESKIKIGVKDLEKYLGPRKYDFDKMERKPQVGLVTGLAWTTAGGDTLTIEVNVMPGKGEIELTGSLGDVMKESARTALTFIRSRSAELELEENFYSTHDIHIHVPAGAVPKDGPSAGITMATALASAFTGRPVRNDLAMTGEITLRGRVMPIGGLKEKAVAAHRAGIKEILIPKENLREVEEIPASVRKQLKITPVENADEVLKLALLPAEKQTKQEEKAKD